MKTLNPTTFVLTREDVQITHMLRNQIDGYNNGSITSKKRIIEDRQKYIDSYWEGTLDDFTKKKLALYDIMFRLCNSSEEKYVNYFKELIININNLGINEKNNDKKLKVLKELNEIYGRSALKEDPFLDFTHNIEKSYNAIYKLNLQNNVLKTLYRLLDDINLQKTKIFSAGLRGDLRDFDNNEVLNEYPDIFQYKPPITLDSLEKDIIVENIYEPKELKKPKEKLKKKGKNQDLIDIDVNKVEDLVNYFQEFMDKYEGMIKTSREYWQMNIIEILQDLNSEKKDHQLLEGLIAKLYNDDFKKDRAAALAQEAAEFLLKYRKDIIILCKIKGVFEKESSKNNQKKDKQEFNKPTNFKVTGVKPVKEENYMMDMANEDVMLVDNYQILSKLLGDDDINKESKNKEKNKKLFQDKKHIDVVFNENDFSTMDQQQLMNFYPFIEKNDQKEYILFKLSPKPKPDFKSLELVQVNTLEPWAQPAFEGVAAFNPIQSKVFTKAFHSDENILICAPTGAGKTNVALLTIMRELEKHVNKETKTLTSSDFKIVYISPMKALAAEIVEKFSTKLKYLNVQVKELTGDIQLSKQEILDTHVIVTTPEKWDVVTRKSDGMSSLLKILIIDEIHLLNDERGPVLECLVARTLMSIERLQSTIRLVGLSATLPNYIDVAGFLGVSNTGVFFFDQSYRPVPLIQNYIGIKDPFEIAVKAGKKPMNYRRKKTDIYNDLCYELVRENVKKHKQVMVFVHSRKDTLGTANLFIDKIKESNDDHYFKPHEKSEHREKIAKLRNKALQKIMPYSIGIHNAGLLRKDRNVIEKLFLDGYLRVLVTTATLAWGVNLPAYAVIIKGTDIYDPKTGTTNLSVLDVQQIFGRAGRPQFDTEGEATLMTDFSKVSQYMGQLNNAGYIESKFLNHLKEALNAEIVLGNVTSEFEAMDWLKYTYFSIRFRRNPIAYQFSLNPTIERTYQLEQFMQEQLQKMIGELNQERLIRYDSVTHFLSSTELGRITSHFYIKSETMAMFCEKLGILTENNQSSKNKDDYISEFKLMTIMAKAKEFENLKVRDEESFELKKVMKEFWIFEEGFKTIKRPGDMNIEDTVVIENEEKILILISGYLKQYEFDSFSLVIDTQYVIQNSIRILRCILEIAFKKNLANLVDTAMRWCKYLENRMTPYQSSLRQFCKENNQGSYNTMRARKEQREGFLDSAYVSKLEIYDKDSGEFLPFLASEILEMDLHELSFKLDTKNPSLAKHIQKYARFIPQLTLKYSVKPITSTILKITVNITPKWTWDSRWHSKTEVFMIYVHDECEILHNETVAFSKKHIIEGIPIETSFFVPHRETENNRYNLVVSSDRWVEAEVYETIVIEEEECMVNERMNYTKLLELTALSTAALNNPAYESLYKFKYFNPIQTQIFHPLYHTDNNVLIGAPTGSGKTIMAELAMLRLFEKSPEMKIVYIAPLKALAKERIKDWKERLEDNPALKKKILELTGDYTPDLESLLKADVLITTPEKWDGISRNWQKRSYVQRVGLMVFDEIHLLGQDRGPVIEVIVSRMNYIADKLTNKIRMVGLSTAMANGSDVANWFGVPPHFFFNFKPHLRPVPLTIYFTGFPERHYCPRMATMNKPAYNAIKSYSDGKPVLIFVSSRRQTRLTALDLIALLALEFSGQYPYLKISQIELDYYLEGVKDTNLKQTLTFGIGMHHAGLVAEDRKIVEELFVKNKIQVLIATSTLAWGVNFPARLVIVKGTEYYDAKNRKYIDFPVTDLLQMIGRAGRPQFDDKGIACVYVEQSKKNFYRKYLNEPFPIESNLISQLPDHFNAEIASGTLVDKQACIDYLSWTYFFRRLIGNPKFYGLDIKNKEVQKHKKINDFLVKLVDDSLKKLSDARCVKLIDEFSFEPFPLGFLASYYYIKHETISYFEKKLTENLSIYGLVDLLSKAKEFDEVPVRHNEDNYNEGLAKICPFPVDKKTLDSPNTKTNLLFQAHFSRLPLPIRDYLTDMKLVLDSSIRIIHALIDLATDKGFLNITLNLMYLMQMIIQGVWIEDSGFKNISHFDQKIIANLWNEHKISHLCQLVKFQKEGKLETFLRNQSFESSKGKDAKTMIHEIIEEIKYFPDISGSAKAFPYDTEKMEIKSEEVYFEDRGEAIIKLSLKRENSHNSLRVKIQKGSKEKDCSWWIVVGNPSNNKTLLVKKTFFKTKLNKDLQISLPTNLKQSPVLNVYLISDSYIGLDQIFTLNFETNPKKKPENNNN